MRDRPGYLEEEEVNGLLNEQVANHLQRTPKVCCHFSVD